MWSTRLRSSCGRAQVLSRCLPAPGTCRSIALTKTALAQALAKFSRRPVDAVPYPIPTHAPPGPGSALLTAPDLERRRESKDKGAESSREGREAGAALWQVGASEGGRGGLP